MSEWFYGKLQGTDWHLLNAWKEALVRLLDERHIDEHVAWRLVAWLDDLTNIARQEGLFNLERNVEHDPVECLRVTDRLAAMYSYAMTTGHFAVAAAISVMMSALQAGILPIYNTYCQTFMTAVLYRTGILDPNAPDAGLAGDPLFGIIQFIESLTASSAFDAGPRAARPSIERTPYLVSGPPSINYALIEPALAQVRRVVACAREYVEERASRFDLNALVEDELYTATGADNDVLFVRALFSGDIHDWLGEFFSFWNSHAAGCGDTYAQNSPDDAQRLIMFARQPGQGMPPGDGWRLLHTARLLGLWPLFDLR